MRNEIINELNLLNKLVDSIQEGVIVLDRDFKIKKANKKILSKISGKETISGHYCHKVFRNLDTPCANCPVLKTFESAEINKQILINPLNEKNEAIYEVTTSPILSENGEVELVIESYNDITHLTQFKDKLFESEKKYKDLFEKGLAAIVVADDQGNYITANKAAADLFGYSINELNSMNIADLQTIIQPDAAKRYQAYLKKGEETGEFDFKTKNGVKKVAIYKATRIKENFNVSMLFDITQRKNIEQVLASTNKILVESEELYRKTFEKSPVGLAHVDKEGNFLVVNELFCEITGYTKDDLLKIKSTDITHPDDLNKEQQYINQVLNNKIEAFSIEKRYLHKKGHVIWINLHSNVIKDENNQILFAVASIIDITSNKEIENKLLKSKEKTEESERKFKAIADTSPLTIYISKGLQQIATYINPKFYQLFGYTYQEVSEVSLWWTRAYPDTKYRNKLVKEWTAKV